jgi:ABC-type branched-subunit amino acid transport system substrate-binding protein
LVATVLAAGLGCSATRFDHDPCTAHSQCRDSFGFGAVCQPDGLCGPGAFPRCDRAYPEDLLSSAGNHRDAIVFGSLVDRSSPAEVIQERAVRLAVKEANAGGGLDGQMFGVVQCDIQQSARQDGLERAEAAVQTADFLSTALGVPALIGPASSAEVEPVWEVVSPAGTLVISPSATSPALTRLEPEISDLQPGLLWTTAPTDRLQGKVIAEDMLARGIDQAHMIRETGVYAEELARLFSEHFRAGGGTLQIESIPSEARIVPATVAVPPGGDVEVLFISSRPSWIVKFLEAASAEPGYADRAIFLTDAAANQAVLDAAAGAAALFPRIRGTRPAPPDPNEYVFASFLASYRAEYAGETPLGATYAAHAYDAAWLALYGAAWSVLQEGAPIGPGMARGLRHIAGGAATPMLPASWKAALAAFRAGRGIDVEGASGNLDYDPATKELEAPLEIWGVSLEGGRFMTTSREKHETRPQDDR